MSVKSALRVRPVILCGGAGTRLWPASRENMPKQFVPLAGERSSFQETVLRVCDHALFEKPLIVTNRGQRFLAEQQLREIGVEADILLEPLARDSGPAILAASLYLAQFDPMAPALVLAADHLVRDVPAFCASVREGLPAAQAGRIVTFGISPTQPATGYGYIEAGDPVEGGARLIRQFVEKPDQETALACLSKGYLWNSGNFLFVPDALIRAYAARDPGAIDLARQALALAERDLGALALQPESFARLRKISFDYAVMEHCTGAAVVECAFGWSDIGGWDAIWSISAKDDGGNACDGRVVFAETTNSYARSEGPLVTLLGVEDLIVVANRDAVLVADRHKVGALKALVERLRAENFAEADASARAYRPWGWYQTLDLAPRFQVKRIVVYPGGRLSLQKHFHRAEHWVVVKGRARITLGEASTELAENQSAYIPPGSVHRLENPGEIDTEIIEVQTGSYLGEDDIVRLEDAYRRQ